MVVHFATIFDQGLNDNQAVITDTHLLVPIRKDNNVTYEDIWSHEYAPYVSSMAMLSAAQLLLGGGGLKMSVLLVASAILISLQLLQTKK